MKFQQILSGIDDIVKYPQRRKKQKLYQQWVERAELPAEAVPREEANKGTINLLPRIDRNKLRKGLPYIIPYTLLGIAIIVIIVLVATR